MDFHDYDLYLQKIFVLPNMEDVCLPIMSSKLPD